MTLLSRAAYHLLALVMLVGLTETARALTPDDANRFIATLGQEATQTLNSQGTLEQKELKVREILARSFDLQLIGRYVVGQSWRTMTPDQQEQYSQLFQEYVLRTYSKRLGGYSGQQFQVTSAKPINQDEALVTTTISRPSASPIEASWRVKNYPQSPKIVDVLVSGVSMVVTQRSEFSAVIQRQGINGLIETLRLQISKFSAQSN
jgi:phospholipid transport system substrate-binding protein